MDQATKPVSRIPCPLPAPRDCSIFYGYVVLGCCILAKTVANSGTLTNLGFVVPGIVDDQRTHITTGYLSSLFALATLFASFAAPALGGLIDSYGARICIPVGCVGAAAGLTVLSAAKSNQTLVLGFFIVRSLCNGAVLPWSAVPVSHWFDRHRGKAQSYLVVGTALIVGVFWLPAFEESTRVHGWRRSLQFEAAALVVSAIPIAMLMRHDPESVGCHPDGIDSNRKTPLPAPVRPHLLLDPGTPGHGTLCLHGTLCWMRCGLSCEVTTGGRISPQYLP